MTNCRKIHLQHETKTQFYFIFLDRNEKLCAFLLQFDE